MMKMREGAPVAAPQPADRRDLSAAAAGTAKAERRVYVWWGAAFMVLAALGLFCWAFLGPVVQARGLLSGMSGISMSLSEWYGPDKPVYVEVYVRDEFCRQETEEVIETLGGSARAAYSLRTYLWLPKRWTDGDKRTQAISLLPYCGKPGLPVLLELTRSSDVETRRNAAWALGQVTFPAPEIILPLAVLLEDEDATVRLCAARALAWLAVGGEEELPADPFETPPVDREWVIDTVSARMRPAVTPDPLARARYANALGEMDRRDDRVIQTLVQGMSDQDAVVRRCSAWAAQHLTFICRWNGDGSPVLHAATKALKDDDDEVRVWAAWTLSRLDKEALPALQLLQEAVGDPDSRVRCAAAYALGRIGPQAAAAVPALEKALEDEDAEVRFAADMALSDIRGGENKAEAGRTKFTRRGGDEGQ